MPSTAPYDTGKANMIFAWDHGRTADASCDCALKAIEQTIDLFGQKFPTGFSKRVTGLMAKTPGFSWDDLVGVLSDMAAYARRGKDQHSTRQRLS